jgi:hypothetical protein
VVVFSVEERERVRERLLEFAHADERVVAGAVVGAEALGPTDRWSDLDLTFAVGEGASIQNVVSDWTRDLRLEFDAVHLFDLRVTSTVYRVFLLPGNLQVDLSFTPAAEFGPIGPRFRLLFGSVVERPQTARLSAQHLFGLAAHHLVRARFCIERGHWWRAEYWISEARDQALTLACRQRGFEEAYGRGFDRLPAELLRRVEPALVRSLERDELLRALAAAVGALLRESDEVPEMAAKLEPQLQELTLS